MGNRRSRQVTIPIQGRQISTRFHRTQFSLKRVVNKGSFPGTGRGRSDALPILQRSMWYYGGRINFSLVFMSHKNANFLYDGIANAA